MPYRTQALTWRDTEETLRQVPCTCIDGRSPGLRYSVAGGSLGLILQVLAAIEAQSSQNFTADTVVRYLDQFADTVGPVYMHTDQHMASIVFARMGLPPGTQLVDLTAHQQRSFRELAVMPEYQGCGHLKLIMARPSDYGTPVRLIAAVLTAFFNRYFSGRPDYQFEVLAGEHAEVAAVFINHQASTELFGQVPLYASDGAATHFFCHRPMKQLLLERYLLALTQSPLAHLPLTAVESLMHAHNRAADLTLEQLAHNLPREHLNIAGRTGDSAPEPHGPNGPDDNDTSTTGAST